MAGPFYVEARACIGCGAPEHEAPGLITSDDDGCYFRKQPETAAEVDEAIRAVWVSCVGVYRYDGTDPAILVRLAELGEATKCDRPLDGHPVVVRDHARFALAAEAATTVAGAILKAMLTGRGDDECTVHVHGDAHRAAFEYTHSAKYAPPIEYVVQRVATAAVRAAPYRAPAPSPTWLLIRESPYPPTHLVGVLASIGAVAVRWFSSAEWLAGAEGRELPY